MDSPSDFYGQGRSRYNLPAWELLQEQGCAAHEQGSKWDRSYLSPWRGDRGRGRSEISTLWLSWLRRSLLALATNPLRGYGEDNKAFEKMKQLFFYPCVKKKTPAGLISKPQQGEGAEAVEFGSKLQQFRVIVSKHWNLRSYKEADE